MRDGFSEYHPIVNMIYYMAVMGTAMFVMHPFLIVVSFIGAAVYEIYLKRKKGLKNIGILIPVFVIMSIINPLFSHEGVTLLCYLPTGNPLTLESIIYGLLSGLMIVTVILWFGTFNIVMTGDKILAVTGKCSPAIGMLITMVFRFVPKYKNQAQKVIMANRALEGTYNDGTVEGEAPNLRKRIKKNKNKELSGIKYFGIMSSWSLENSVITADSMGARGYGSGRRNAFSMYDFERRDGILILLIAVLTGWNIVLCITGKLYFMCYPVIKIASISGIVEAIFFYSPQIILCLLPIIINTREEIKWHRLKSKI